MYVRMKKKRRRRRYCYYYCCYFGFDSVLFREKPKEKKIFFHLIPHNRRSYDTTPAIIITATTPTPMYARKNEEKKISLRK